jgi:parallel beta-helix repeat protein
MYRKTIQALFAVLTCLLPVSVSAYEAHEPIIITDIHATADDPYIIEGYEITNPDGTCIEVKNSEHVIIRNNYLHNCGTALQDEEYHEGYALLVGDAEDVTIEGNVVKENLKGVTAYRTQRLKILNNIIERTMKRSSLMCEICSQTEVAFNTLKDNGVPEHFWVPGDRIIGIWMVRSDDVDIHDNTVIRSTSDGIGVTGQVYNSSFLDMYDDWTGLATNVRIYRNTLLDNMEQGIWLVRAKNIEVYDNVIRTGCATPGGALTLEFSVSDSEFYNNELLGCLVTTVAGGAVIHNNYFHDNTYYGTEQEEFFHAGEDENDNIKAQWAGIEPSPSSGNRVENNSFILIDGALAEKIEGDRETAHREEYYEAKGWFACEIEEGKLDEECVQKEEAKGNQGIPSSFIVYDPLMADFSAYTSQEVVVEDIGDDNPKQQIGLEEVEESPRLDCSDCEYEECEQIHCATCEDCDAIRGLLTLSILGIVILGSTLLFSLIRRRQQGIS